MKTKRLLKQTGLYVAICLIVLISSQIANAANQYILDGATGTYTTTQCDSWATNRACDSLPASLVRGDTYYIADGNYPGYTLDDTVDGTKVITIKKATAIDHGTDVGWNSAYGDGQAIFQYPSAVAAARVTINITRSFVIWDGVTGSGSDVNSYGFKVVIPSDFGTNSNSSGGYYGLALYNTAGLTNVIVRHTAVIGPGYKACLAKTAESGLTFNCANDGIWGKAAMSTRSSNVEIANNYASSWVNNFNLYGFTDSTIHDNYFTSNTSGTYIHGQNGNLDGTDNVSIYNNVFHNSNIYAMAFHGAYSFAGGYKYGNRNTKFYNNIINGMQGPYMSACVGLGSYEADTIWTSYFHHNTYLNVQCNSGAVYIGNLTDVANKSYAYNNLLYNVANPRMDNAGKTAGAIVHDNNAYLACTGTISSADESTPKVGNEDPFVDAANGKYQLKTGSLPINAGKALIATYSTDRDGVARPQGGAWDIGAYEYLAAQSTLFVTSVNGTVTSNPSGINCGSTCYTNFDADAWVTLTALPNSGYTFAGWSGGGCSGTGTCTVSMASAQTVAANYTTVTSPSATQYYLSVGRNINTAGSVTASDGSIKCGSTCKAYYPSGKTVTLTATANSGYIFYTWVNACKGQGATCTLNMNASKSDKAYFVKIK